MRTKKVETKVKKSKRQRQSSVVSSSVVSVPAVMGVQTSFRGPKIMPTPRGTIVENSESIATFTANVVPDTEQVGSIQLSARSTNLPWLSQMGALYSKYRIQSLTITTNRIVPLLWGGRWSSLSSTMRTTRILEIYRRRGFYRLAAILGVQFGHLVLSSAMISPRQLTHGCTARRTL